MAAIVLTSGQDPATLLAAVTATSRVREFTRSALQEAQKRLADRDAAVGELRKRCDAAQVAQARAEQERTAIIAALGWRVKRRLEQQNAGSGAGSR